MTAAPFEPVGRLQIQCLHVLWRDGALTIDQLHRSINMVRFDRGDLKPLAYTTILTVMRNLARRGLVTQDRARRSHVFKAVQTRDEYRRQATENFVETVFAGDRSAALMVLGSGVKG